MIENRIVKLVNLSTGESVARLGDAQVQELRRYLEQESVTDTNFYISPETIEFLREQGAGELAGVLATALGNAQGVQVGYAPIPSTGSGHVRGRLLDLKTQTPLIGYKVEAYDEDVVFDDLLGWCYADSQGKFELHFDEAAFKDSAMLDVEGEPEVKLRILNVEGAAKGALVLLAGFDSLSLIDEEVGWVGIVRAKEVDFGDIFVSATGKLIAPLLDPDAAAICPSCGTLYRSGFSTCSNCQIPVLLLAPLKTCVLSPSSRHAKRSNDPSNE